MADGPTPFDSPVASSGPPAGPPPGWYRDPAGGTGQRWWDGHAWTGHVHAPAPGGYGTPPFTDAGRAAHDTRTVLIVVGMMLVLPVVAVVAIVAVTFLGRKATPPTTVAAPPITRPADPTTAPPATVPSTPATPQPAGAGPLYVSAARDVQMWTGSAWKPLTSASTTGPVSWTIGPSADDYLGVLGEHMVDESLDRYTAETVALVTKGGNVTVASQETVTLADGTPAMHVSGTASSPGRAPAAFDLIITVRHDQAAVVSFTTHDAATRADALRYAETVHLG